MVEVSTIPFFQSLEKWIFKGQVFDPYDEVCFNIYVFYFVMVLILYYS